MLLMLDLIATPHLTCDTHNKYKKTLPLGSTFLSPAAHCIPLASPLSLPRQEAEVQRSLEKISFSKKELPNIYLFVIETLRYDFITSSIAPNMSAFGAKHISPELTYSNANSTHVSLFSIFHSTFPFHWTHVRNGWKKGSIPLQLFKKMGYQIRVYTAADLGYFSMDQILFGKERRLVDSIADFSSHRIEPCERDALAIQSLNGDISEHRKGTLFLVFLDSTHSEYSSPSAMQPFQPAATSIDYLTLSQSTSDLARLQNRYRNAIHWIDHLIGHFFTTLQNEDLYEESIIVLTGDHGEEFFEEGALFHGTHLNEWQTHVPIFYKFPKELPGSIASISTHIDIFPSMLHTLTQDFSWAEMLDGQSIFSPNRSPYALSVQHNGHDVPYEFSLTDGSSRLHARFLNPPFIHSIPSVEILSIDTPEGKRLLSEEAILECFPNAFAPLLTNH